MKRICFLYLIVFSVFLNGDCVQAEIRGVDDSYEIGTQYLKHGEWEKAVDFLGKALISEPVSGKAHFNLGCALALSGKYDEAIVHFEEASHKETEEFQPFIQFNIGSLYYKKGLTTKNTDDLYKAQEYFKRAASHMPRWILANDMIGFALNVGERSTTLTIDVVSFPPDSARFCKTSGHGETEVYIFNEQAPPLLFFYHSPACLALLAMEEADYEQFIRKLSGALFALETEPQDKFDKIIKFNCLLAKTVVRSIDQLPEVIPYVKEAIDLGLNYPRAYATLGRIYFYQQRFFEAKQEARKALVIDPNYEMAKFLLADIEAASR